MTIIKNSIIKICSAYLKFQTYDHIKMRLKFEILGVLTKFRYKTNEKKYQK